MAATKITWMPDNLAVGSTFAHEHANEIKTVVNLHADDIDLINESISNVDNTSDLDKPVSTAQQTAIDLAVQGLYDDRGNYDASGNTFPSTGGSGTAGAILKGDIWTISVAGTLGGTSVKQGDTVRALQDTPGQTSGNWAIVETGLTSAQIDALTFVTPAIIAYTTSIPFNKALTDIAEHVLDANDVFTIDTNGAVDNSGAQVTLINNSINTPDLTAFLVSGDYDNTATYSILTFERRRSRYFCSITNHS